MNRLITILAVAALTGCTSLRVDETKVDGSKVSFNATSLFSNSTLKGLKVAGTTKTTSALLGVTAGATEPNVESITASGEALGNLIGTAAAAAAKSTVKP